MLLLSWLENLKVTCVLNLEGISDGCFDIPCASGFIVGCKVGFVVVDSVGHGSLSVIQGTNLREPNESYYCLKAQYNIWLL